MVLRVFIITHKAQTQQKKVCADFVGWLHGHRDCGDHYTYNGAQEVFIGPKEGGHNN